MERAARTILIVEDEERIAQLIRKLIHLEELGLSCTGIAKNGQEGYETIMKDRPDIVITDIRMPRINGLDLIEMVRQQHPEVRFIVLSGYKEFEYAHRALQYEVDGYLLKPINEAELNETLGRIVGMLDAREEAHEAGLDDIPQYLEVVTIYEDDDDAVYGRMKKTMEYLHRVFD